MELVPEEEVGEEEEEEEEVETEGTDAGRAAPTTPAPSSSLANILSIAARGADKATPVAQNKDNDDNETTPPVQNNDNLPPPKISPSSKNNGGGNSSSGKKSKPVVDESKIPTNKFFSAELNVTLCCNECGWKRSKLETYRHFSLDVEENNEDNVEKALDRFFFPGEVHFQKRMRDCCKKISDLHSM